MNYVYDDGGRSKYFKAQNVGDCAIRAIAIATGKDYEEVYEDLKKLNNGKSCRNGTPKKVDKKYLTDLGWVWHPTIKPGTGVQVHLSEDELPGGILIVQVSKHLVCVKDGVIYDTYNCSRGGTRAVYGYWTPPTDESKRLQDSIAFNKKAEEEIKAQMKAETKKIRDKYNKEINALKSAKNKEVTKIKKYYAKKNQKC